jgi:hypothetical protein
MKVTVERHVHAQARGNDSELVHLSIAARLAKIIASPGDLDGATSIGAELLTLIDDIPGVESVWAGRYRLSLEIGEAFDAETVLAEVLAAISTVTGQPIE